MPCFEATVEALDLRYKANMAPVGTVKIIRLCHRCFGTPEVKELNLFYEGNYWFGCNKCRTVADDPLKFTEQGVIDLYVEWASKHWNSLPPTQYQKIVDIVIDFFDDMRHWNG